MVSRKTVATLLLVHVVAMLASQTEAFVPIFTYSELQRMQVRTPCSPCMLTQLSDSCAPPEGGSFPPRPKDSSASLCSVLHSEAKDTQSPGVMITCTPTTLLSSLVSPHKSPWPTACPCPACTLVDAHNDSAGKCLRPFSGSPGGCPQGAKSGSEKKVTPRDIRDVTVGHDGWCPK